MEKEQKTKGMWPNISIVVGKMYTSTNRLSVKVLLGSWNPFWRSKVDAFLFQVFQHCFCKSKRVLHFFYHGCCTLLTAESKLNPQQLEIWYEPKWYVYNLGKNKQRKMEYHKGSKQRESSEHIEFNTPM